MKVLFQNRSVVQARQKPELPAARTLQLLRNKALRQSLIGEEALTLISTGIFRDEVNVFQMRAAFGFSSEYKEVR
jgi:hypothetical protein